MILFVVCENCSEFTCKLRIFVLIFTVSGISKNREHKRQLRIYSNADSAVKQIPKHELEAQRRQEALSKPVSETNKGFGLLAKMGYKPGKSYFSIELELNPFLRHGYRQRCGFISFYFSTHRTD
jgi:hypothetical protein